MVLKCKNTVILTKALHSPLKSSNLFFSVFFFFEGGGGYLLENTFWLLRRFNLKHFISLCNLNYQLAIDMYRCSFNNQKK